MPQLLLPGRLLLLASFLFLPLGAGAQNIIEGYWGLKGGFNLNKVTHLNYPSSIKSGFHAGIFANFQISDRFSIMHEVLYSQRGISIILQDGKQYNKTFSYIDLPWTLNYFLNKNFFISLGVQPSIYAYFKTPAADSMIYNKDNVNTIEVSYLAGATFLFDNNFGFGARVNGSLVPLFQVDRRNKNYVLQVYLLYAVNKRKGKRF